MLDFLGGGFFVPDAVALKPKCGQRGRLELKQFVHFLIQRGRRIDQGRIQFCIKIVQLNIAIVGWRNQRLVQRSRTVLNTLCGTSIMVGWRTRFWIWVAAAVAI